MKTTDYIEVADRVYKHINPTTKMCTPNTVYISTERWYKEWQQTDTKLDLFDWILENKK